MRKVIGASEKLEIVYLADQPHHVEELARLHDAEWGHLHPRIPLEQRVELLRKVSGHREIPTVLIAIEGTELVGSSALVTEDMDDRPDLAPWLAAVYVKAEHRRRGIASVLVSRVEEEAASLGVERIYLFTEHEQSFYAKRGWDLMERRDYYGTRVALMDKSLV